MTDAELFAAFEGCTLPCTQWDHLAHVRTAFLYLSSCTLEEAIVRMRSGLLSLNASHGNVGGTRTGYHETMTQAFMRLLHVAVEERGPFQDSSQFCAASPELLDARVLLCYYMRDRILQPDAKAGFVQPDIAPLDRVGLFYPEFGRRLDGAQYTLRPGAYGVIEDADGRIAVVETPAGVYLPGGGQESAESAIVTLQREAQEECGLSVQPGAPLGMADELVYAEQEHAFLCKRCSFYAATVVECGAAAEPDHRLLWLPPDQAVVRLSHASQIWAIHRRLAHQE